MKKIILFIIAVITFNISLAQFYLEPSIGYQIDMNNNNRFKQINTSIQISYKASKYYQLLFQIQRSWPVAANSLDSAFTAISDLSLYTPAKKTILPFEWSYTIGHRVRLSKVHSKNVLSFVIYTGIIAQKIAVNYQYDKSNYTILNPDQTRTRTNLFIKAGVEYLHPLKQGNLFLQLNFSTPPAGGKMKYPTSFNFIAPVSLNIGYAFPLNKSKHEKK